MPPHGQPKEPIARRCFPDSRPTCPSGDHTLVPPIEQLPDRALEFCRSPQHFLLNLARTEGPVARFRLNDESFAVLSEPAAAYSVLNGSQDDYEKGELYDVIRGEFGGSVFTIDDGWSDMRAGMLPLLSDSGWLSPTVAKLVKRQIERWVALPAGETVHLLTASKRLAFDVVSRGLLVVAPGPLADELFESLSRMDRSKSVRLYYLAKRITGITAGFPGTPLLGAVNHVAYAIAESRYPTPAVRRI